MKYFLSFCLAFSFCLFTTSAVQAQATAAVSINNTSVVKSMTVKVTGVGCNTDVKTIGTQVEKLDGVNACTAAKRGAVTRFVVQYNPDVICEEDIYQAIEATPGCKNPNDRPYRVKL